MKTAAYLAYPVLLLAAAGVLLFRGGRLARRMGVCVLVSALFWACTLIPRLLTDLPDYLLWRGLGRLGAAVCGAVRIFLLYLLWERLWSPDVRDRFTFLLCAAGVLVRLLALVPPENRWTENGYSTLWSSLGAGALLIAGAVPTAAWFFRRNRSDVLRPVWLLLLIWLAFSIPLSAAERFPVLDWLLIPQAAADLGIAACFLCFLKRDPRSK